MTGQADRQAPTALAAPACEARYFQALAQGNFEIPRCSACGRWHFYPRACCPYCHAETLEWRKPGGRATVYSTTTVRRPDGDDCCVCLVDLEEGPRMMTTIADIAPAQVHIGMAVQARIQRQGDAENPLLVFVPLRGADQA